MYQQEFPNNDSYTRVPPLQEVANLYLLEMQIAEKENRRPTPGIAISRHYNRSEKSVSQWIFKARKKGLLPPSVQGRIAKPTEKQIDNMQVINRKPLYVEILYMHFPQVTSTIDRCAECKKPFPCPTVEIAKASI